jgi:hypothetical protein
MEGSRKTHMVLIYRPSKFYFIYNDWWSGTDVFFAQIVARNMLHFKMSTTVQKFITVLSTAHHLNFRSSHVGHASAIHAWERTSRWVSTISDSCFAGPGFKSQLWGQLSRAKTVVRSLNQSRQIAGVRTKLVTTLSIYRVSNSSYRRSRQKKRRMRGYLHIKGIVKDDQLQQWSLFASCRQT